MSIEESLSEDFDEAENDADDEVGLFHCTVCNTSFPRFKIFLAHVDSHSSEECLALNAAATSEECPKLTVIQPSATSPVNQLANQPTIIEEPKTANGLTKVVYTTTPASSPSKNDGMRSSTTAECSHCRRLFVNERALKIHINKSHGSDVKSTTAPSPMIMSPGTITSSASLSALTSTNSASFAAAALSTLNGLINAAGAQLIVTSLTSSPGITNTTNSLIITPSNAINQAMNNPNTVSLLNAPNLATLNLVSSPTAAGTNALSFSSLSNVTATTTTTTPSNFAVGPSLSVACDECGRKFPTSKQTKVHKFKSHIEPRRKRELFLKQHKLDPIKSDLELNDAGDEETSLNEIVDERSPEKTEKEVNELVSKIESGTIYCQKCDRPFLSEKALQVHILKAHASAPTSPPSTSIPTICSPSSSVQISSPVNNQSQCLQNNMASLPHILPRLATKPIASLIQNNSIQSSQTTIKEQNFSMSSNVTSSGSDTNSNNMNFKVRRAPGSGHLECNGCGRSFTRMNNLYRHKKLYCTTFQMRNRVSTAQSTASNNTAPTITNSKPPSGNNNSTESASSTAATNVLTASAVNAVNALVATLQLQQAGITPLANQLTLITNPELQNTSSSNTPTVKMLTDEQIMDNRDPDDSNDEFGSEPQMTTTSNGCKVYQCSHCQKTFNLVAVLRRHLMVHKRGKAFSCEKCGAAFTRKYNLRLHRDFRCKLRGTSGLSANLISSSYLSSSEAASDNDANESKDALTSESFNVSARDVNGSSNTGSVSQQPGSTVHSNKNTLIGSSLTSSLQSSNGVVPSHNKRYSCSKCQVGFNHASNLYTHIKRYCRLRDLPSTAQVTSSNNESNNKKMTILAASITPQYQKQLQSENANPTPIDNPSLIAHEAGKISKETLPPNTCYLCHRQFDSARGLTRHRRRIHKISARGGSKTLLLQPVPNVAPVTVSRVLADPPSDCSEIACETCHKWFTSPRALAVHRVRKHNVAPVSHIKRVRCEFCRKRFRNPLTLQMHRKMHMDGLLDNCGNSTQSSTNSSAVTAFRKSNGAGSLVTPVVIVSPTVTEETDKIIPDSTVSEVTFANFLKEQREQILGKELASEEEETSLSGNKLIPLKNADEHLQLDTSLRSSDGQYECRVCSRLFVNRLSLTGHLKSHYKESSKPYSCGSCVRRFTSLNNLRYHRSKFCPVLMQQQGEKEEENKKPSINEASDNKMPSPSNNNPVEKKSDPSPPLPRSNLECLHCNKKCSDHKALEAHAMHEHSTADYGLIKCIQCSRTFASYSAFRLHMTRAHNSLLVARSEGKENSTSTVQCDDLASDSSQLLEAASKNQQSPASVLSNDHQDTLLKMKLVNQNFVKLEPKAETSGEYNNSAASKLGVKNANFSGMPFICTKCGRSFQTVYGLGAHMRFCRDRVINKSKTRCQVCQRIFITEYALQVHTKICKQVTATALNNVSNANRDASSKSCCKNCGRKFGTTRALGAHSRFCKPYQGKAAAAVTPILTSLDVVRSATESEEMPATEQQSAVEPEGEKQDEDTSGSNTTETMEHPDGVEEMGHEEVLLEKKLTGEDIEKYQQNSGEQENLDEMEVSETNHSDAEGNCVANQLHQCDICGRAFTSALTLGSHLRMHKEPQKQKFSCTNCKKSFPSRSKLFYHQNWFCSTPANTNLSDSKASPSSTTKDEETCDENYEPVTKKPRESNEEFDKVDDASYDTELADDEEKALTIDIDLGVISGGGAAVMTVSEAC